jgi:hypothetical protein
MITDLIIRRFETPLGIVVCGLNSDKSEIRLVKQNNYKNGFSETFQTVSYQIELIDFKVKLPLINGDSLTDSNGWIWRFIKTNDNLEQVQLYCRLIDSIDNVDYDIATGEHLDAIEASNNEWILNIGTEDSDVIQSRALQDDWFPKRIVHIINDIRFLTRIEKNGLSTVIPVMIKGEKLHIQYLAAFDKILPDKLNTWIAVDQYIRNLEKWIGIENE